MLKIVNIHKIIGKRLYNEIYEITDVEVENDLYTFKIWPRYGKMMDTMATGPNWEKYALELERVKPKARKSDNYDASFIGEHSGLLQAWILPSEEFDSMERLLKLLESRVDFYSRVTANTPNVPSNPPF